ncbi:hypothetical protein PICMEDRAFT_119403 [Pichia membranifaciens NRRL Y-2026]|uniref:Uncharacterized protein n=1 Tax=Pichia membranifaciens NRRL Y-2026 TaxID=763406 RepID=A0A1E3NNZ6_9ASCO|nr:hypothetical protein PICMEDRAFT_119403 [Pichia membranifaciens NRRL Y-2026]ODQ47809.1 hypothetical protein PICMEDRAFT_119403 [Pichia membranifaciens NRRL Y-2026]
MNPVLRPALPRFSLRRAVRHGHKRADAGNVLAGFCGHLAGDWMRRRSSAPPPDRPWGKLTSCVSSGCPSPPLRRGTERACTGPDGSVWSVHCLHRLHWFRAAAPSFLCSSGKRHRQAVPGHEPRAASGFMPEPGLFPNPAAAPKKKAAGRSTQKTRTRT